MQGRLFTPSFFLHLGIFIFFVFGMITKTANTIGVVLLLLTSLYVVIYHYKQIDFRQHRVLVIIFTLYAVAGFIANIVGEHSARDYESGIRFLLVIPIIYTMTYIGINRRVVMWSIALSGIAMGGLACYEVFYLGINRAGLYPIRFGNIGMLTAFFALTSLFFVDKTVRSYRYLQCLIVLGMFGGFTASILSGTRGGWLFPLVALPLLGICFAYQFPQARKGMLALMTLITVGGIALYMIPGTVVADRVHHAISEVKQYQPNSLSAETSVGARLEMWRVAWLMIQEKPSTGWGIDGYRERTQQFVDSGESVPTILHRHPHNEILNDAVKRGIVSTLILIIGLYIIPFYQFSCRLQQSNYSGKYYALLGLLTISAWVVFGLVDVFLEWNQVILYYLVYISVFWGGEDSSIKRALR